MRPAAGSRDATIESHLPLVETIARRYAGGGEPLEDLVQAGRVGLIKAVDRYDPARHDDLAALARRTIEGEIRHHLRDGGRGPHLPRGDRELAGRLRRLDAELTAREGRPPRLEALARAAGVEPDRAAAVLAAAAAPPVALQLDDDPPAARAEADAEAAEARLLLAAGWDVLDERDRTILRLRYEEDRSQSEIAREVGLSQAHVSRLLRAALRRLRDAVGEPALDGEAPEPPSPPSPAAPESPAAPGSGAPRSGRLLLRLPQSLHTELARAAAREQVPLNTFIAGRLAAAVGWGEHAPASGPPDGGPTRDRRRRLLIANLIVIAVAAAAGVALLVAAWVGR